MESDLYLVYFRFIHHYSYGLASKYRDMAEELDKRVRDKIPEVIKKNGEEPVVRFADDEVYSERLAETLEEEEVAEYREA